MCKCVSVLFTMLWINNNIVVGHEMFIFFIECRYIAKSFNEKKSMNVQAK